MTHSIKASSPITTPWIARFKPNKQAKLNLFCFPYAGGGAAIYRAWANFLPESIEVLAVQPPGRGNRLREAPMTDLSFLLQAIAVEITPYLDKPFAFFGHSMGALTSFELTHKLRAERGLEPAHLFLSGRRAPQIPDDDPAATYNLPESEFIEELRRLNGTPPEVLGHSELMQLMIPLLRADFQVCQTYSYSVKPPLGCSITAIGGLQDKEVTREHLEAWRCHTSASFSLRMLPGDHFFLHTYESTLLQVISRCLNQIVSGG